MPSSSSKRSGWPGAEEKLSLGAPLGCSSHISQPNLEEDLVAPAAWIYQAQSASFLVRRQAQQFCTPQSKARLLRPRPTCPLGVSPGQERTPNKHSKMATLASGIYFIYRATHLTSRCLWVAYTKLNKKYLKSLSLTNYNVKNI